MYLTCAQCVPQIRLWRVSCLSTSSAAVGEGERLGEGQQMVALSELERGQVFRCVRSTLCPHLDAENGSGRVNDSGRCASGCIACVSLSGRSSLFAVALDALLVGHEVLPPSTIHPV